MWRPLPFLLTLAAAVAACTTEPIPSRPAWDQHVLPLLQGRCNHCHGETVLQPDFEGMPRPFPTTRLDVCNVEAQPYKDLGIAVTGGGAVTALKVYFPTQLEIDPMTGRRSMPPAPAEPLSDWEYQVLKKWVEIVSVDISAACLKAVRNREPKVTLVEPPKDTGEAVEVVIEVTDADNDGMLGKATLGSATFDILGAGRRILRFPKGTPTSATLGVVVTDGYDTARL
jgi:hypothetical protein